MRPSRVMRPIALQSEPNIQQVFIAAAEGLDDDAFERLKRALFEHRIVLRGLSKEPIERPVPPVH